MSNPNYKETVTLYHCLKAAENGGKEAWTKTVIKGCFYSETEGRTFSNLMENAADKHICRMPISAYAPPSVGDVIVLGECGDVITGEKGSRVNDLLKANPHAFKVQSVTDNSRFPYGKHIKVVG